MNTKLTLEVLYSDGTISNEYDKSKKAIAVVSNGTYVGLKNTIKTKWSTVCSICEKIHGDNYYGFLPPISILEFWMHDIENINATMRELKELGVNAEELYTTEVYWSSSHALGEAKAMCLPLGIIVMYAQDFSYYGRAAIAFDK